MDRSHGCILDHMVVFLITWLYSRSHGCILVGVTEPVSRKKSTSWHLEAPIGDDQSAHVRSLIRVFVGRSMEIKDSILSSGEKLRL